MENTNPTVTENVSQEDLVAGFSFNLPDNVEVEETIIPEGVNLADITRTESEVIEEQPKPEIPAAVNQPENFFKNLVKKKIEQGIWEDVLIKDGDVKTKLSEIEDIDEDEYYKLELDQKALADEDLKEKFIPVDKLDEHKKLLIDIVKNGGDLKEIFKTPQALEKPFDENKGWDLSNPEHQYSVVYQQYLAQGLSESRAKLSTNEDVKEGILEEKSQDIVTSYQTAYTENLKKINSDLIENEKQEQEKTKEYKSALDKGYKQAELAEGLRKKLLDVATKKTENGYLVDDIYEETIKDAEKAQDLIFFLTDKKKYLEYATSAAKNETNLKGLRTISRIPKDRETTPEEKKAITENNSGFQFSIQQ